MANWNALDRANVWHPFSPLAGSDPLYVKSAQGLYLHLEDGREIMDVISSWWVNVHGHCHPKIAKAIARQAYQLEHVIFAGFTHKPAIKLADTLLELLPGDQSKVFFSDNGSTATEVAIKLAIQYWYNQGVPRKKVIAIEGAYHGDTFGAMSVGDRSSIFNAPFTDYLFDVAYLPFPERDGAETMARMQELATEEVAAFIFEPLVQGAGGMRMYSPEVLDTLMGIAQSKDIICIADEVMTGFGRTGKMFACDYLDRKPDVYCLSKGITGGFLPMGVTTVNERIEEAFDSQDKRKAFFHGHSYTANPMACAAANASCKLLLKKKTQKAIKRIGQSHEAFVKAFVPPAAVAQVRQTGTILAIELKADDPGYVSEIKDQIYAYFLERDILLRPLGNVIYLIPPFVITKNELQTVYEEITGFLATL